MSLNKQSTQKIKDIVRHVNSKIREEHNVMKKKVLDKIRAERKMDIKKARERLNEKLKEKLISIGRKKKEELISELNKHKKHWPTVKEPKKIQKLPPPPEDVKLSAKEEAEMQKLFEEAKKTPIDGKPQYVTKRIGGKIRRIPVAKLDQAEKNKKEERTKAFTVTGASGKKTQLYYKKGKEPAKAPAKDKPKPKIPKITVTEVKDKNEGGKAEPKSQLPKLKEKPVKLRVAPKKEKKPEPAPASSSLSKVFLNLSSEKKKMLQELIDNDELSSNKKSQKRAFNNLEDTHNKFVSDSEDIEDVFERMRSAAEIQDIIDDDEDGFKLYSILYGKPTKKQIDENIIGGAKFLLNNYKDLNAAQLGGFRNFLNSFDLALQRKLIRENKEAYLANVASLKDKTGQKAKLVKQREAKEKGKDSKAKKAFEKEQEEFKKAKAVQDKEAKVGEKLRAQARDASKKANEKFGLSESKAPAKPKPAPAKSKNQDPKLSKPFINRVLDDLKQALRGPSSVKEQIMGGNMVNEVLAKEYSKKIQNYIDSVKTAKKELAPFLDNKLTRNAFETFEGYIKNFPTPEKALTIRQAKAQSLIDREEKDETYRQKKSKAKQKQIIEENPKLKKQAEDRDKMKKSTLTRADIIGTPRSFMAGNKSYGYDELEYITENFATYNNSELKKIYLNLVDAFKLLQNLTRQNGGEYYMKLLKDKNFKFQRFLEFHNDLVKVFDKVSNKLNDKSFNRKKVTEDIKDKVEFSKKILKQQEKGIDNIKGSLPEPKPARA